MVLGVVVVVIVNDDEESCGVMVWVDVETNGVRCPLSSNNNKIKTKPKQYTPFPSWFVVPSRRPHRPTHPTPPLM